MEVTVSHVGSAAVAAPEGEVDTGTASSLREKLMAAMTSRVTGTALAADAASPKALIVDLSRVTFLDSSGLGVLSAAAHRAARLGCSFSIAEPSPTVTRMLAVTSLDRAWPVFPSLPAALAAVVDAGSGSPEPRDPGAR